jgi:hypothetical protein
MSFTLDDIFKLAGITFLGYMTIEFAQRALRKQELGQPLDTFERVCLDYCISLNNAGKEIQHQQISKQKILEEARHTAAMREIESRKRALVDSFSKNNISNGEYRVISEKKWTQGVDMTEIAKSIKQLSPEQIKNLKKIKRKRLIDKIKCLCH